MDGWDELFGGWFWGDGFLNAWLIFWDGFLNVFFWCFLLVVEGRNHWQIYMKTREIHWKLYFHQWPHVFHFGGLHCRQTGRRGVVRKVGWLDGTALWWPCFFATCNLHGNWYPQKKDVPFPAELPLKLRWFFHFCLVGFEMMNIFFQVPVLITRTVCQAAWLNSSWNLRKLKALLVPLAGSVEAYPYPDTPQISPNNDKLYIVRVSVKTQWSSGLALFWTNKSIFQKISADKNVYNTAKMGYKQLWIALR